MIPLNDPPKAAPEPVPAVAFDFDGTLTWRDSVLAFLEWRCGRGAFLAGLASLLPATLAYVANQDRGALKSKLIGKYLGGLTPAQIAVDARAFHASRSEALMRPDALARWRDWQTRGARLLIVTASPEIIVRPFAEALGADMLIGTRLAVDPSGLISGALDGPNCRGPEKVARLRTALGVDALLAAAYGDTSGDADMLRMADVRGYRVFRQRPTMFKT